MEVSVVKSPMFTWTVERALNNHRVYESSTLKITFGKEVFVLNIPGDHKPEDVKDLFVKGDIISCGKTTPKKEEFHE